MSQNEFIQIGKRKIGPNFKPLVIFELGINHNGNIDIAKSLIDNAKDSAFDAIKFQKRDIETVYAK